MNTDEIRRKLDSGKTVENSEIFDLLDEIERLEITRERLIGALMDENEKAKILKELELGVYDG